MSETLPDWTTPDGKPRKLGFDPERAKSPMTFRADVQWMDIPDVPDSELVPFDLFTNPNFWVRIKDQGSIGACTGHMAATGMERMLWQANYRPVSLSPWYLYSLACGGVDRGAVITDVIDLAAAVGTCREALVPRGTYNPRTLSSEAKADAKNWRIEIKAGKPKTWRDWIVGTHLRATMMHSVPVNSGFDQLDRDGVPNNSPGVHNHAVCSGFGLKKTARQGWVVKTANSWGTAWGQKGCFWTSESTIEGDYGQAVLIMSMTVQRDLNPPKVAE